MLMLLRITTGAVLLALATACQSEEATTTTDSPLCNVPPAPSAWEKGTSPATAVLSYDSVRFKMFPDARAARLDARELAQTEQLLAACIEADNQQLQREFQRRFPQKTLDPGSLIELKNYHRQLIPVLNKHGEKEVLVNCLCQVPPTWRTRFLLVSDGGSCYFSVKLNLTRGTWYELIINGEA